ncbi:MAG: hypothetical protein ABI633_01385 [Burkholderiales bacterium]
MPASTLAELLQAAAKQEQERLANQIAEANEKLVSVAYDKAATYTTVIIFGGYAGLFGIWQLTREHLTKEQTLWSALLIMVSLLTFVMFEVVKMILITRAFMAKFKVLNEPTTRSDPQKLLRALEGLELVQKERLGPFMVVWAGAVAVCLIGALGAVAVLTYAFVKGLVFA